MSEPTITTYGQLDQFADLAERRLYRLLIVHAERKVARIERGETMIAHQEATTAAALFMAARELRAGRP